MASSKSRRRSAPDRRRPVKKKVSILVTENIQWVDYKDVNLLRRFMSERAKIRARRVTGNTTQQQRAVARAIRVAREMALLPYSVRQVTQRGARGRGRDRDRDRDRERPREGTEATTAEAAGVGEAAGATTSDETPVEAGAAVEAGGEGEGGGDGAGGGDGS